MHWKTRAVDRGQGRCSTVADGYRRLATEVVIRGMKALEGQRTTESFEEFLRRRAEAREFILSPIFLSWCKAAKMDGEEMVRVMKAGGLLSDAENT